MRSVCRLLALLTALPFAAQAADDLPPREIAGPVEARVVKVRDGDTVEVEAFIWPLQTVTVAVRLRNVDAPELKGDCEAERAAARDARDRLVALVGAGPVRLTHIAGDKYFGRVLADLAGPDEPDIGKRLLREGLVDAYDGGRRRDWCAALGFRSGGDAGPRPG
ncbi:thermonuclease family protein [Aureimonas sp. AU12]|uniref:thermonuclease family protein n=1 Tax=Aureimonas sp. AU12 TaxID=1638161 RepID=UPI000785A91D|nr:thermonuclease family protein [Aureimonas sp. AU12]